MEEVKAEESPPVEETDALNTKELNEAAHNFSQLVPRIRSLSRNLGRNALCRVYSSIIEFPLADKYPKFDNKAEHELFVLSLSAMAYKNTMMTAVAEQQRKTEVLTNEAINKAAEAVKESENVKEE